MLKVKAFRKSRWLLVGAAAFLAGWAAEMPGAGAAPPGDPKPPAKAPAGSPNPAGAQADASGATSPAAVNVLVLIVSEGNGPDRIAFTYDRPVPKQQAQRDLEALAKELGQPVPRAKITTEAIRTAPNSPRMTSVETAFPSLVDRTGGRLPLAPHARAFRRFPRVRVTYFVFGPFQPANPVAIPPGEGVEWIASGQPPVFTFDLQRTGSTMARTSPGASSTRLLAIPIVAAAMAGVAAYLAARASSRRGRPDKRSRGTLASAGQAPGTDGEPRRGAPPSPPVVGPEKTSAPDRAGVATSAPGKTASCPSAANERER